MARLNINVDDELYKNFKMKCVNNDITITDAITQYMKEVVDYKAEKYKEDKIKLELIEWIFERVNENGTILYPFMEGVKKSIEEAIIKYESE